MEARELEQNLNKLILTLSIAKSLTKTDSSVVLPAYDESKSKVLSAGADMVVAVARMRRLPVDAVLVKKCLSLFMNHDVPVSDNLSFEALNYVLTDRQIGELIEY